MTDLENYLLEENKTLKAENLLLKENVKNLTNLLLNSQGKLDENIIIGESQKFIGKVPWNQMQARLESKFRKKVQSIEDTNNAS